MYPTLGFHFKIKFIGLSPKNAEIEEGFQSISGLEAFMTEELPDSMMKKKSPGHTTSYSPLVLKRAVVKRNDSKLSRWLFSCLNNKKPVPLKAAIIQLLDETHKPFMQWKVKNLLPLSWKLNELNAERTEILIETIELKYEELSFDE